MSEDGLLHRSHEETRLESSVGEPWQHRRDGGEEDYKPVPRGGQKVSPHAIETRGSKTRYASHGVEDAKQMEHNEGQEQHDNMEDGPTARLHWDVQQLSHHTAVDYCNAKLVDTHVIGIGGSQSEEKYQNSSMYDQDINI